MSRPSPETDPIIRLHDCYFQMADVMFDHFQQAKAKLSLRNRPNGKPIIRFQTYARLWLSLLRAVGEGFENNSVRSCFEQTPEDLDLQVYWGSIHHKFEQLGAELQRYRNATFRFQNTQALLVQKREEFLLHGGRHDPLTWAIELHLEIRKFFSRYRSLSWALQLDKELRAEHGSPQSG